MGTLYRPLGSSQGGRRLKLSQHGRRRWGSLQRSGAALPQTF